MRCAPLQAMPTGDETTNSPSEVPFLLPKYLRFARSLALVSGAAIGIAAGAAVLSSSGCGMGCSGICGAYGVALPLDAGYDTATESTPSDSGADGSDGSRHDGGLPTPADGSAGGGPRPAPALPAAWLA
jgi:hypothetical protein